MNFSDMNEMFDREFGPVDNRPAFEGSAAPLGFEGPWWYRVVDRLISPRIYRERPGWFTRKAANVYNKLHHETRWGHRHLLELEWSRSPHGPAGASDLATCPLCS